VSRFERLSAYLLRTPLAAFLLTFACIVTLRNVLEIYSDGSTMDVRQFVDFSLFYISLGLSVVLLLRALSPVSPPLALRGVLLGLCIVVLPPVIDLLATGGRGLNIGYVHPRGWRDALRLLLTWWGGMRFPGATLGIKLEVLAVTVGMGVGVRYLTGSRWRGVLAAVLLYLLIFVYSVLPWLAVQVWSLFDHAPARLPIYRRTLLFAMPVLAQLIPVMAWNGGDTFRAVVGNLRWARMLHFLLMPFVGMLLAGGAPTGRWAAVDWMWFCLAMLCGMVALTVRNDIADRAIDRVSNPRRPLAAGSVRPRQYACVGRALLGTALVLSLLAGFRLFLYVAAFMGVYVLYSEPPLRLKRVPVLSKLLIAAATLLMVLAGFDFAGGAVRRFPPGVVVIFLFIYGVLLNFIDLKDYEGDRRAGIFTLPVLLGLRRAQWLLAVLFVALYPLVPWLAGEPRLLWACVPAGLLSAVLVLARRYRALHDRLVILVSLAVVVFYLAII